MFPSQINPWLPNKSVEIRKLAGVKHLFPYYQIERSTTMQPVVIESKRRGQYFFIPKQSTMTNSTNKNMIFLSLSNLNLSD